MKRDRERIEDGNAMGYGAIKGYSKKERGVGGRSDHLAC